jgi:hypothetical protein
VSLQAEYTKIKIEKKLLNKQTVNINSLIESKNLERNQK